MNVRSIAAAMAPIAALPITILMLGGVLVSAAPDASRPSAASALSVEASINRAFLTSDADALESKLAGDWIVVSGFGGIAERKSFLAYVREGGFTRKRMILSEPRVRLYGNTAVVTTHLSAAGRSLEEEKGKIVSHCFDVQERQTDVLVWKHGAWQSVLLHETIIPGTLHVVVKPGRTSNCG